MDLLIQLTDGIFNPHAYKETGDIDVLVKYARAAVAEDAALPWDKQRTTLAKIVDQVAKCSAAEGLKQKGWFKALKELQQGGPCKKNYPPPPLTNAQQLAANRAQGFVGIPVTQRHGMNGQRCTCAPTEFTALQATATITDLRYKPPTACGTRLNSKTEDSKMNWTTKIAVVAIDEKGEAILGQVSEA